MRENKMRLIDLSRPLDETTPVYPGDQPPTITIIATMEQEGYREKHLSLTSHSGTHIDAPSHMLKNGKNLDDFPLEKFQGEAVVLSLNNPDYSLIKEHDIVLFSTTGIMTKKTAEELIRRKVSIIGVDSLSPDEEPFPIHKMLLKEDILIVENLINLNELVGKRFYCRIFPLNIRHADGAPCRVVAQR